MKVEESVPRLVENRFLKLPHLRRIKDGERREWVYFVQCEVSPGLIKIGHASNLKWRLTGLQTQCPVQLKLVGAVIAPAGAEFCLHEIFKAERQHGEWFLPSDRLRKEIARLPQGKHIQTEDLQEIASRYGRNHTMVTEWLSRVGTHKRCLSPEQSDKMIDEASFRDAVDSTWTINGRPMLGDRKFERVPGGRKRKVSRGAARPLA